MGLANWWAAQTEGAAAPWPLKRAKIEPQSQQPRKLFMSQQGRADVAQLRRNLRGLKNQAKEMLQQYVSLYPSLVQLKVPCTAPPSCTSSVLVDEPVVEPEPVVLAPTSTWTELPEFALRVQQLADTHHLEARLTADGCGGVYLLHDVDERTPLAVFKPRDEEYMAPQNPRGYVKEGVVVGETEHPVNKGFLVGNGALRERAVYLLDQAAGGFSGVPATALVKLPVADGRAAKEGSVQQFIPSECSAEDMGPLKFSIPEVHKIGLLDVRLFNTDRHAGNILLHKSHPNAAQYDMTPIDHGFCLPSFRHLDNATFDWLSWPQAQFPFTSDEMDHIASLDATRDAAILESLQIERESITTMKICTNLLQVGAEKGFSLFEIGSHLQRDGDFSQPSPLEKIVAEAIATVEQSVQEEVVWVQFEQLLLTEVDRAVVAMFDAQQPKRKARSISCFS